jgi:carbon storage regulator
MLVLARRAGEEIVITGGIQVTVLAIKGSQVRLGFLAPPAVRVMRAEVVAKCNVEDGPVPAPAELSGQQRLKDNGPGNRANKSKCQRAVQRCAAPNASSRARMA